MQSLVPAIQWYEGMLLSPQHFQQLEMRWHQILSYQISHAQPYFWGIQTLEFDSITLPTGLLRVLNLEAVMPDGLLVQFTAVPQGTQLEIDLTPYKHQIMDKGATIYLAVPIRLEGASPVTGEWPRFQSVDGGEVRDDNAADNVIQIPRLLPKLNLILADEPPARYSSFPIAKVGYVDESYVLKTYLPPYFSVKQTDLLGTNCARLTRRIREKAAYLSEKWQSQIGTPLIGETSLQLRPLVLSLPILEPLILGERSSPYELHRAFCLVAGQLATLRLGQVPPIFPEYNHNHILESFTPVLEWISLVVDSLEKAYSVLLFALQERVFSIFLHPEIFTRSILVGLRTPHGMSEGELKDWMKDAIITTESFIESARIRRITGAPRTLVKDQELYELMPGRGVLIFQIDCQDQFIKSGERLVIFNPADSDDKRPTEIVLYLKHQDIVQQKTSEVPNASSRHPDRGEDERRDPEIAPQAQGPVVAGEQSPVAPDDGGGFRHTPPRMDQ